MIQIFNPSRLTRQPFFIELIRYLDQHDDVILREIKAQFPDVAVDKLMEEYIKAGLILRENKRYYLNLPMLESLDSLELDQEIFVSKDSPAYQALLEQRFETELRNQTNAAILVENGVQQTQTITYKGKQFLTLTIQQKRKVSEDLKNFIAEHGIEAAKQALKEGEDKDESVQEARKIPGFSLETNLLSETEIETKTSYDFQVLDVKKASESEYLKNVGLENLLKNEPEEYIENRVASGATVQ